MAILLANLVITLANFGAGCFANTGTDANPVIKFLSWISPMHYGVEIIFKVVTKGRPDQDEILEHFGYTDSYAFCFAYLFGFIVFVISLGWFLLWVKNRHH